MGAGKSAAGRELARLMDLPLYDTDALACERFAMTIPEIFASYGEEMFREAESEVVRTISRERAVVVTGGGIVLRRENVAMLRARGTIVYLRADEETLAARLAGDLTRPLLRTDNPRRTIHELLLAREPLYAEAADVVIDTANLSADELAQAIERTVLKVSTQPA